MASAVQGAGSLLGVGNLKLYSTCVRYPPVFPYKKAPHNNAPSGVDVNQAALYKLIHMQRPLDSRVVKPSDK